MSPAPGCVYLNTSILVKAVNTGDPNHARARRFLEECCRRYRCVVSPVHGLEPWRPRTRARVRSLLRSLGAEVCRVDVISVLAEAGETRAEWGVSRKRTLDIAHMEAARRCGCKAIIAVDRFIRARATLLGLDYMNYYTGCK